MSSVLLFLSILAGLVLGIGLATGRKTGKSGKADTPSWLKGQH